MPLIPTYRPTSLADTHLQAPCSLEARWFGFGADDARDEAVISAKVPRWDLDDLRFCSMCLATHSPPWPQDTSQPNSTSITSSTTTTTDITTTALAIYTYDIATEDTKSYDVYTAPHLTDVEAAYTETDLPQIISRDVPLEVPTQVPAAVEADSEKRQRQRDWHAEFLAEMARLTRQQYEEDLKRGPPMEWTVQGIKKVITENKVQSAMYGLGAVAIVVWNVSLAILFNK